MPPNAPHEAVSDHINLASGNASIRSITSSDARWFATSDASGGASMNMKMWLWSSIGASSRREYEYSGQAAAITIADAPTIAHRIPRPGTALLTAATCLGLLLMVFSRAPWMELALPVLVLVGFSNTFYLTQVSMILQQTVPDQLRGRVMSLYSLCWNLLPLGGLLAGVLAAAVDARFAVLFGGGMVAANALLFLMSRRLRTLA